MNKRRSRETCALLLIDTVAVTATHEEIDTVVVTTRVRLPFAVGLYVNVFSRRACLYLCNPTLSYMNIFVRIALDGSNVAGQCCSTLDNYYFLWRGQEEAIYQWNSGEMIIHGTAARHGMRREA
ncbi:hypothetical protein ACJX0J_005725, partial [Zea mays]